MVRTAVNRFLGDVAARPEILARDLDARKHLVKADRNLALV